MKTVIYTKNAPKAVGPYSQAIKVGEFVFTSGQIGLDPETGVLVEGIEAQTEQSLKNLGAVLEEASVSYKDVVKTTVFLADMNDFAIVNQIYSNYFTNDAPARSCVQVAKLPKEGLVEIEAVAVCK